MAREKLFNMRMSEDEWHRLEALAEHYSLNAAGLIRMLIKARFDEVAASQIRESDRDEKKQLRKASRTKR